MKKYHFVTPSNQKIVLDDQYTYRDFLTVEDLKYLFTVKMRLYSMEMFEIVNSKKEMLDYSTKLRDFPENHVFHILHIDIKKSTTLDTKKESEREVKVIVEKNTIKEPETVVHFEHFENFENDKNEKIEEKEKVESKKSCVIS